MIEKMCSTNEIKLFISGPIEVAKQIIRRHCMDEGLCVTIEPTTYIYTGGEETGYVVTLRNYPRFPSSKEKLKARAILLANDLLRETCQHSFMVVTPTTSYWKSIREENK